MKLNDKPRPKEFAKKILLQKYKPRAENPFKRDEFPTLKDITIDIVAQNF